MTGVDEAVGPEPAVAVAVLLALVLGSGAGAVLRALVLARVQGCPSARARSAGSAWVNLPASALAAAVLVCQQQLDLLPGRGPAVAVVPAVALLGLCGGLSTWSTLALELSRSLLDGRRQDLLLQLGGVAAGVLAGFFGAGLAAVVLLLPR